MADDNEAMWRELLSLSRPLSRRRQQATETVSVLLTLRSLFHLSPCADPGTTPTLENMFVVKIVVLWLAVLQITTAFDVVSPFSWKAVEDAEDLMATGTRHASAAVASLYADSVRLQQRVKEHVFAPEFPVSLPEPECSPLPLPPVQSKATGGVSSILLTLVAIPAAFLLGWVCGTRQALSRQAMQQARAADQEAAALYQTDLKASKSASMATPCRTAKTSGMASKAGAHVSAPHAIPPAETQDEAQVAAGSTADRPLNKANSGADAESSNQASPAHQASALSWLICLQAFMECKAMQFA